MAEYVYSTLPPDTLKNARLLLRISQIELGAKIGLGSNVISRMETTRGACSKTAELAIKFLLVEAGLYSHFRMLYMNKKQINGVAPAHQRVTRHLRKNRLVHDALAFKYDA